MYSFVSITMEMGGRHGFLSMQEPFLACCRLPVFLPPYFYSCPMARRLAIRVRYSSRSREPSTLVSKLLIIECTSSWVAWVTCWPRDSVSLRNSSVLMRPSLFSSDFSNPSLSLVSSSGENSVCWLETLLSYINCESRKKKGDRLHVSKDVPLDHGCVCFLLRLDGRVLGISLQKAQGMNRSRIAQCIHQCFCRLTMAMSGGVKGVERGRER